MNSADLPVLAIVVPCYNEQEVLPMTVPAIDGLIKGLIERGKVSEKSFALYVNDGSRDATWRLLSRAAEENPRVAALNLAANVGHQNALMAGLEAAAPLCDAAVSIDAARSSSSLILPFARFRDTKILAYRQSALALLSE